MRRAAFLGVAIGVAMSCGGETTGGAPAAAASTCRDEAHRETDVDDVACDEGARLEIVDGWIVCRCTPAPSTGGMP